MSEAPVQKPNLVMFWLRNARWHSGFQSLLPAVLVILTVAGKDGFNPLLAVLAALGSVLAHLGANLLDDYFDYYCQSAKARQDILDKGELARGFKCAYITSGQTTTRMLFAVALLTCALALAAGAAIFAIRGVPIVVFAALGAFIMVFYSAPPLRFSFHGLGELAIGIIFGPILMNGVAWSALGRLDNTVVFLSILIGLLNMDIVYVHSILDMNPDRLSHKTTLAVLCGNAKAGLVPLAVILLAIFVLPAIWIATGKLSPVFCLVFLAIPMAIGLWRSMVQYAWNPKGKVFRKKWMGPMEFWDFFVQNNLDWFLLRWFIARNLLNTFVFLSAIAVVVARFIPSI